MKTTLSISDATMRAVKREAARRGQTMSELVESALRQALSRALVERCQSQSAPWYLTWGIVYEFLRVTTHPAIFRRPFVARDAWSFLEAVFASPGFCMLDPLRKPGR